MKMKTIQFLIVRLLNFACKLLHWVPGYRCRLARWSYALDHRWEAGMWVGVDSDDME
jgi:hypothetical protein